MRKNFPIFIILLVPALVLMFMVGMFVGARNSDETVVPVESLPVLPEAETGDSEVRLNLNTATAEELMSLPGIGEKLSQAIITYRNEIGTFQSVWQLEQISGIGVKTIERIEPYLTLS